MNKMTSNIDESVNMIGHDHYLESIISESAENTVTQDFNEVLFSHPQNETITPATEMNSNFDESVNINTLLLSDSEWQKTWA